MFFLHYGHLSTLLLSFVNMFFFQFKYKSILKCILSFVNFFASSQGKGAVNEANKLKMYLWCDGVNLFNDPSRRFKPKCSTNSKNKKLSLALISEQSLQEVRERLIESERKILVLIYIYKITIKKKKEHTVRRFCHICACSLEDLPFYFGKAKAEWSKFLLAYSNLLMEYNDKKLS